MCAWLNNSLSFGKGILTFASGAMYDGDRVDDQQHGNIMNGTEDPDNPFIGKEFLSAEEIAKFGSWANQWVGVVRSESDAHDESSKADEFLICTHKRMPKM